MYIYHLYHLYIIYINLFIRYTLVIIYIIVYYLYNLHTTLEASALVCTNTILAGLLGRAFIRTWVGCEFIYESGMVGLAPKWVILPPNGTNPGLFQIRAFWLGEQLWVICAWIGHLWLPMTLLAKHDKCSHKQLT